MESFNFNEEIIDIGVSISYLQSLVKILIESYSNDNLRKFDYENLTQIILEKIEQAIEKLNLIEETMNI